MRVFRCDVCLKYFPNTFHPGTHKANLDIEIVDGGGDRRLELCQQCHKKVDDFIKLLIEEGKANANT